MFSRPKFWIVAGIVLMSLWMGSLFFFPLYGVWQRELEGRAELAQAEWTKRVAVESAKARRDSATLDAEAEVERAKGVAEANRIIGDSLRGKEEYLRYLYITGLKDNPGKEVIYIPTEAGIPILESQRLRSSPTTPAPANP